MSTRRLYTAFAVYGVLAVAALPLRDERVRLALWVFLAGLAAKSYVAWLRRDA
jgi:hypothetical protein